MRLTVIVASRFLGNVKLKGVILIGGEDGYHPSVMKLCVH